MLPPPPQKGNSQPRGTASRPWGSELLFKPFPGNPGAKIAVVSRGSEQEPCACPTKADSSRRLTHAWLFLYEALLRHGRPCGFICTLLHHQGAIPLCISASGSHHLAPWQPLGNFEKTLCQGLERSPECVLLLWRNQVGWFPSTHVGQLTAYNSRGS